MKSIKSKIVFSVIILTMFSTTSCLNNKTLASFDVGKGRIIKVKTEEFNMNHDNLSILYELNIDEKVIGKSFLYVEEFDRNALSNHRYAIAGDKSEQLFLLLEISPETEKLHYLSSFDFNDGFRSGGCGYPDKYCSDKQKRIWEIVKNDNPNLNFADATFE